MTITKDNLIELATKCINDDKMIDYKRDKDSSIGIYKDYTTPVSKIQKFEFNGVELDSRKYENKDPRSIFNKLNANSGYSDFTYKLSPREREYKKLVSLTFDFEKEPPLVIGYNYSGDYTNIVSTKKHSIKISMFKTVDIDEVIKELEVYYYISCGRFKFVITEQEHADFIKLYDESRNKFLDKRDATEILSRLRQYSK